MSGLLRIPTAAFALACALAGSAQGHPLSPALLQVEETGPGQYQVFWKSATDSPSSGALDPVFPARCRAGPRRVSRSGADGAAFVQSYRLDCGSVGLSGETVGVRGDWELNPEVLLRARSSSGEISAMLREREPVLFLRPQPGSIEVLRSYFALGFEHILGGFDHLLFVLGLFLLASSALSLVRTVTAFTLAHSITLTCASLGLVQLPQPPVEAAIAASIALLAVELARPDRGEASWTRRRPWAVAFAFGLLHGFGFAAALHDAGLPRGQVAPALLSFNLGVEAGQLAFIGALFAVKAAAARFRLPSSRFARLIPLGMGSVASWICCARIATIWTGHP